MIELAFITYSMAVLLPFTLPLLYVSGSNYAYGHFILRYTNMWCSTTM